jgi:uncharacterized small protein (DUF1192 family)
MPTLQQKRQVIAGSNDELAMMQDELGDMQRALEKMLPQDRESFEQRLVGCQEVFAELDARFAALRKELRRLSKAAEQSSGQSTSPLEDPNPPGARNPNAGGHRHHHHTCKPAKEQPNGARKPPTP